MIVTLRQIDCMAAALVFNSEHVVTTHAEYSDDWVVVTTHPYNGMRWFIRENETRAGRTTNADEADVMGEYQITNLIADGERVLESTHPDYVEHIRKIVSEGAIRCAENA